MEYFTDQKKKNIIYLKEKVMPKDQVKSVIIDLVLIGDGPLFNHCVNFLKNGNIWL